MSELRSTYGGAFIKGIEAGFFDAENQAEKSYSQGFVSALGVETNEYTSLFKKRTSDKAEETIAQMSGFDYPELTAEGENYKGDSRKPGYQTVYNFIQKTKKVTISRIFYEDRQSNLESKFDEAKNLKISMMAEYDRSAFSIFNYAFTAQASLPADLTYFADGKPMCSVAHPLANSGSDTDSNASATGIPLNEVNLEIARIELREQTDDRGMLMNIGSGKEILLVPHTLEKTAQIITNGVKRSGTANNDINIYDGIVTVISTKWISAISHPTSGVGSDTAWFLIDSMQTPFCFFMREDYVTSTYIDDKNKDIVHDISSRWIVGNDTWRGVWGSKGDNAAYTG